MNNFLWQGGKPRIKMSLLQQRSPNGRIAFPFVRKHYLASRLMAMKIWWKEEDYFVWDTGTLERMGTDKLSIEIIRCT